MRKTKLVLAAATALVAVAATASAANYPHARPMFARYTDGSKPGAGPTSAPPSWTFTYTYNNKTYNDVFVGSNPQTSNSTTTIATYVIPVALKYKKTTFTPDQTLSNGETVTQNLVGSPLLNGPIDFKVQGTDLGTTQYEDAFQIASNWEYTKVNTGEHVLFAAPTVEPTTTLKVPAGDGEITNNPFGGGQILEVNAGWYDNQLHTLLKKFAPPGNSLPIFLATQVYWTSGGCCIGGWHEFYAGQAYSTATYMQTSGVFSEDVAAFSHELGEWLDDYTTNNNSPCGIYEVGDPLEGEANYGTYPYTGTNGFTYHLQDLVTPPYFGAPPALSLGGTETFVGQTLKVCQNGS
jgi:hypothetical protein